MVKYPHSGLDATFGALADATRRAILARLAQGEASVSDLAAPFDITLPGFTKHLRVLERAQLITRRKEGRVHRCRLAAEPMKRAARWIESYQQYWEKQFDALERYLAASPNREALAPKENKPWPIRNGGQISGSGALSRRRGKRFSGHGSSAKH